MTTRTDYRDALGWLRLTMQQDWEARGQLAMLCDPVGLVDALTDLLLGMAAVHTEGQPEDYLDYMTENLDEILDRHDVSEEDQ